MNVVQQISEIEEEIAKSQKIKPKKIYKNFPYQPYLYNELQFIYLQGNNKLTPRKFKEVVKDCFIMGKYNQFLLNQKYTIFESQLNNKILHFSYDHHLGSLKAKIAKLRRNKVESIMYSGWAKGESFDAIKSGDAWEGLTGFPSV